MNLYWLFLIVPVYFFVGGLFAWWLVDDCQVAPKSGTKNGFIWYGICAAWPLVIPFFVSAFGAAVGSTVKQGRKKEKYNN